MFFNPACGQIKQKCKCQPNYKWTENSNNPANKIKDNIYIVKCFVNGNQGYTQQKKRDDTGEFFQVLFHI